MITLEVKCPFCGKITTIKVSEEGYEKWENGALVGTAFPELNMEEREVLISGMCYECQSQVFKDDDSF